MYGTLFGPGADDALAHLTLFLHGFRASSLSANRNIAEDLLLILDIQSPSHTKQGK